MKLHFDWIIFPRALFPKQTMLLLYVFCFTFLLGKNMGELPGNETSIKNETLVPPESASRDLNIRHRQSSPHQRPMFAKDAFSTGDPNLLSLDGKGPHCRRKAKCEPLLNATCFGVKLPYTSTTLDLVGMTQEQMQEKLQFWTALKHVPKCWSVIQPLLCALYMPRCENDLVELPSQEMCKLAMGPCKILELERGWTSPLRCDDTVRFPSMCNNDARDLPFNTTGECLAPLVHVSTDNPSAMFEGAENCGLPCANPMFTPDELHQISQLIAYAAGICAATNLFTIASFLIVWRSAKKYPGVIIFYINWCFLVVCLGYLVQFLPGSREEIVCRKDGTLRMSQPSRAENWACVIVFVLIYFPLMAACVWFFILAYAWHLRFRAFGKIPVRIDKKGGWFHVSAWSLPFVLTVISFCVHEIDANSEEGICFVGYMNSAARGGLHFGPVVILFLAAGCFVVSGLRALIKLKINSSEIVPERFSAQIRSTIIRVGFVMLCLLTCFLCTVFVYFYEYQNRRSWKESFRTFMICKIMRSGGVLTNGVGLTGHGDCRMEVRPSLAVVQLHLVAFFGTGVAMSALAWTPSTFQTWVRFFRRVLFNQEDKSVIMKKHKLIAQVFAKRQAYNHAGRISVSFHHDDPVGLNFELNSFASRDISSTWVAALPALVTRRGALANLSISSQFSDFSYGIRRASLDSRRQSLDSQLSAALGEYSGSRKAGCSYALPLTTLGVSGGRVTPRHKKKKHHARRTRTRVGLHSRRGSTTSQESQLGTQILSSLGIDYPNIPSLVPNLKRRVGNAGLNDDQFLASPVTARGMFGLPDPSDVTDDDAALAHTLGTISPTENSHEKLKNAVATLKSASDSKFDSSSKTSSQDKVIVDEHEGDCKNSKSGGCKFVRNGRKKRRESNVNCRASISPETSGRQSYERRGEGNVGKRRSVGTSRDKLNDKDVDVKLKLLNSKESNLENNKMAKTRDGYFPVKSGCDDKSSSDSDEENALHILAKSKTGSLNNKEVRKSQSRNDSNKTNLKPEDMSEGSSTSCSQEISGVALSLGPTKYVTISNVRLAREVATQTSFSGGLNEIENIGKEKLKPVTGIQASNNSSTSENDITSNLSHNLFVEDTERKISRTKCNEAGCELVYNTNVH